ncbi:transporter [Alsobacter soli]|uniref:Transporter n=1 Tax=Alsobacter soli TaxID=2109933 RepID=A0A2T1HVY2_9HYPH|nr:transporter [Alsobacter soli]PSC05659.1 transporter [Alsobacter soli]
MPVWAYVFIPVVAAVGGAVLAVRRPPGPTLTSAIQHFTAGVVFAAAAGEILPDLKHKGFWPVVLGAVAGVAATLGVKRLGGVARGSVGLLAAVGVDVFIDGLVLGLGFVAGQREGLLLTAALTLEILFLGLTVTTELSEYIGSKTAVVAAIAGLAFLLPLGALAAVPVSGLSQPVVTGFFAFGLIALLYLVTEELLVEAHEQPDNSWVTEMFFAGFLLLFMLEQAIG